MPRNDFDVVGFGTNAVDYLIRVPRYPTFNSKTELTDHTIAPGGEIASSMVGLARLGLRTAYAGRFGDDPAGIIGRESLIQENVDAAWAESVAGASTQVAFILIDDNSGERTVIWKRDPKLTYTAAEAPVDAAIRGRVLHMTPHDTTACIRMARAAKESGVLVSLDLDNIFPALTELLPLVDICIMSADLPPRLTGNSDVEASLAEIASTYGCGIAGITLGDAGSLILCGDHAISTAAFPVPGGCVDTTGAGDAFRAGFLYGLVSGYTVEQSALTANAVAALKCRSLGARTGLPDPSEVENLKKKSRL